MNVLLLLLLLNVLLQLLRFIAIQVDTLSWRILVLLLLLLICRKDYSCDP